MVPPRLVRRLVLAPIVVVIALALAVLFPALAVVAAVLGLVHLSRPGRMRGLRVLWFAVVWLTGETAALFALLGLWLASGFGGRMRTEPFQARNYATIGWFLDHVYRAAERTFGLQIMIEEPEATPEEQMARLTRPVIVLSLARGPGRLRPARAHPAQPVPAAPAGGDEGLAAARPDPGRGGQPGAERLHPASGRRAPDLHRADRAAGQRAGPGRRPGDLPGGRQLDPGPLAAGHPAAAGSRPRRPGRPGPADAEPAATPGRRRAGRGPGLPGRGRGVRGPRGPGRDGHRGRRVAGPAHQPDRGGPLVAGARR